MFGARCLLIPKDDPQNEAGVMSWPNKLQIPVTTRNLFFRFSAVSELKRRYSCRKKDNLKIVQKLKFIGKIIMAYHITKINIICHICLKVLNRYPEKDKYLNDVLFNFIKLRTFGTFSFSSSSPIIIQLENFINRF